jgi:hypothetical protein
MDRYLSPRKSWVIVAVVCVLAAAALWAGREPSPREAVGADISTQGK